jgi:hypothetical protein
MPQSPGGPRGISFSLSRAVVENGPDKLKLIPQGIRHPPETEALREIVVSRHGPAHEQKGASRIPGYRPARVLRKVNRLAGNAPAGQLPGPALSL